MTDSRFIEAAWRKRERNVEDRWGGTSFSPNMPLDEALLPPEEQPTERYGRMSEANWNPPDEED